MKSLLLILTAINDSNRQAKVNGQLRASGHRVIETGSFKQAQTLIGNGLQPDLLFLDAMSIDAAATVQVRRLLKKAQHIPMVLIAEPEAMQWRKELESLGASFFRLRRTRPGRHRIHHALYNSGKIGIDTAGIRIV